MKRIYVQSENQLNKSDRLTLLNYLSLKLDKSKAGLNKRYNTYRATLEQTGSIGNSRPATIADSSTSRPNNNNNVNLLQASPVRKDILQQHLKQQNLQHNSPSQSPSTPTVSTMSSTSLSSTPTVGSIKTPFTFKDLSEENQTRMTTLQGYYNNFKYKQQNDSIDAKTPVQKMFTSPQTSHILYALDFSTKIQSNLL
jgi:hypothetical protein